jgi:Flp pilus assembly protein TadD
VYMKRCTRMRSLFAGCITLSVLLGGCAGTAPRTANSADSGNAPRTFVDDHSSAKSSGLFDLQRQADAAYEQGRLLDAEQLYRRMLKASPSSGYAWMRLGNVQLRNDQLEAAIYAYRQCLRFETSEARCWQNLSLTYVEMAVATLNQADGKTSDEPARERMANFKQRLVESVNVESTSAR